MGIFDFINRRNAYAGQANKAHSAMGNATACQCPVTKTYGRHDTQSRTAEQFAYENSVRAGNSDARGLVLGERIPTHEAHAGDPLTSLHFEMEF